MGQYLSSPYPRGIDGLGLDCKQLHSPSPESYEKLNQLLRGSVTSYKTSVSWQLSVSCVSAYFLGKGSIELLKIYESLSEKASEWPEDDPIADSIGFDTIGNYLDQSEYEGRFFEYFRDCLTESSDWPEIVLQHIDVIAPRLRGSGDWEPLIIFSHAVEAGNPLLVMAALAVTCVIPSSNIPVEENSTSSVDLHIELKSLVQQSSKAETKTLLVAAQSLCEILWRKSPLQIPPKFQQSLIAALRDDIDSSSVADFTEDWQEILLKAADRPLDLCYARAVLFSRLIEHRI